MNCAICKVEITPLNGVRRGLHRDKIRVRYYPYCKICHADYQRENKVKRFYGIDMDTYNRLGDRCSICGRPPYKIGLALDHEHGTGLIRGKLCNRCNRGIAWFEDNPVLLRNAINFIEHPPAEQILGKKIYARKGLFVRVKYDPQLEWTRLSRLVVPCEAKKRIKE
jgi:hypothetical protein